MLSNALMRKAASRVSSLSYVANSNINFSNTITIPASAQAGDIAVFKDFAMNNDTGVPSTVLPSGWTLISNVTYNVYTQNRQILSYKILASGDPGSTITGMTAVYKHKLMYVFRPNVPISNLSLEQNYSQVTDDTPTTRTITPCALPYVAIGSCVSSSGYDTAFSSVWYDALIASQYYNRLAYKIFNSNAADVSIGKADQGYFNTIQCCALVVN